MVATLAGRVIPLVLGLTLLVPLPVEAQVDCSNPDNLCTGDPCVIPTLTVQSPCLVDFGARTVSIGGTLSAVLGGVSFTAQRIEVQGAIKTPIELNAADYIVLNGPITDIISGSPILLTAGGNVEVNKPLTTIGHFPVGVIRIIAGGDVDLRARLMAADRDNSNTGSVEVDAGGVLTVAARISTGGTQTLSGVAGVVVDAGIRGRGDATVSSASGSIAVQRAMRFRLDVDLDAAGDIVVNAPIRSRHSKLTSGAITLSSVTSDIIVDAPLVSRGRASGVVNLTAPGQIVINRPIRSGRPGVRIVGGTVSVNSRAAVISGQFDGEIRLSSTVGDLTLSGRFLARGSQRFSFLGGTIEGTAAGNLIADGRFRCGPGDGCIALSAGGILDTTGATFDKPLSLDCPGSPSGAFLDASAALG